VVWEPKPASVPRSSPPEPSAAPPPTRIALDIETFGINGVGPDRAHLVEGFRFHLIACLVRFREWYVSDHVAATTGAEQQGVVRYAIEANAYQAGDTINLVLTLRERDTNIFVWSDRFELTLANWFEAQQRIVRRIAMSLNVQISMERLMRLSHEPDVSLAVYDKWLRGRAIIRQFSPANWDRATQIFTEAIQEAPDFAPGYSSLAQMHNSAHIIHPGWRRERAKEIEALAMARKAVALDPIDSQSHLCLGWSLGMTKHYTQATVHMELACELNANDSWALISSALFHAFNGDFKRANDLANQALNHTLTPSLIYWVYQVSILFLSGDYVGTVDACDRAQDVIRTLPAWRAAALVQLGQLKEAQKDAQRFFNGVRAAWLGAEPATDEAIGRWLLHLYPISHSEDWEHLRTAVTRAGIPVTDIRHHEW